MLLIVRLYPKYGSQKVWDFVMTHFKECKETGCMPLYASQTAHSPFVAVVFNVREVDQLIDFFADEIPTCDDIKKTQTVTLMRPAFFPIPKNRPEVMDRFRLSIRLFPTHYDNVYKELLNYKYTGDLFPTYISFSFGEEDLVCSIMAKDRDTMDDFIKKVLEPMEGIRKAKAVRVIQSERLMPEDEWRQFRRGLYRIKPTEEHDEEYDWTLDEDHAMMTGAFPHDL